MCCIEASRRRPMQRHRVLALLKLHDKSAIVPSGKESAKRERPRKVLEAPTEALNRSFLRKDRSHARVSPYSAEPSTAFYRQQ
jgi:hypothetical protein